MCCCTFYIHTICAKRKNDLDKGSSNNISEVNLTSESVICKHILMFDHTYPYIHFASQAWQIPYRMLRLWGSDGSVARKAYFAREGEGNGIGSRWRCL